LIDCSGAGRLLAEKELKLNDPKTQRTRAD
jgi:hypothetical protein